MDINMTKEQRMHFIWFSRYSNRKRRTYIHIYTHTGTETYTFMYDNKYM